MLTLGFLALEKTSVEEEKEKVEVEDNAQTIRPTRSPAGPTTIPLPMIPMPPPEEESGFEDYSDIIDDDDKLQEKVADFKVSISLFRACVHCSSRSTS